MILSYFLAKRHVKKLKHVLDKLNKDLEDAFISLGNSSFKDRMDKVKEITMQQLDLRSQIEGPQKNGLHGRHKNGLISEIKRLEEEKIEVLKSILNDNLDPEVSILDENNQTKTMKLSEYMNLMGHVYAKKTQDAPTTKTNKFTVYTGGKASSPPDDDGGSGDNTFH
jgi:hypothetical protein